MVQKSKDVLNIHWPIESANEDAKNNIKNIPLFALSFRPFFLFGSIWAVIAMSIWISILSGWITFSFGFPPSLWHAHEMLFGFGAVIAVGFLLTAGQTWTGLKSVSGQPLLALTILWLSARIFFLFSDTKIYFIIASLCQMAWWCSCIYYFTKMIVESKNKNNYLFIPILIVMAALDSIFLTNVALNNFSLPTHISHSMILIFSILMGVVGGRVIPFFTARGLGVQQNKTPRLDKIILPAALIATTFFVIGFFIDIPFKPGWGMIIVGSLHFMRMTFWHPFKVYHTPLLWSLHASYICMSLGLILLGISNITGVIPFKDVIHLISIGAMSSMILSMISRVSLGHTGRTLKVNSYISLSYMMVLTSSLVRLFAFISSVTLIFWQISAALYLLAFSIFVWFYLPVLCRSRADGRPE